MKVIKRNKDGVIMPYNEVMAKRTDVTVIEDYKPGQKIDYQHAEPKKAAPKKRKTRKKAAPAPTPVVSEDPDETLEALLNGEGADDGADD